jgi:Rrf2 family protein
MKLTRASHYALQALVHFAREKPNAVVASHMVARAEGIPERFLLKILKPLVTAGVLRSVKGPNGGYSLARPAKDISMLEIVEGVDGTIRGVVESVGSDWHGFDKRLGAVCEEAASIARERLGKVKLSELAKSGK